MAKDEKKVTTVRSSSGVVVERTVSDLARAAVSGWLGTALEFMDFQLYSLAAALVFNHIFFTSEDAAMAVVAAMATYGVGYLSRPLGAWFFGRLGDRIGRTRVLYYTIALMGVSTTLIGALPTYDQVGILAPILLVLLRLLQGFGAGAEIAGSSVMLTEYAPRQRRGLVGSLVALGTNSGTLLASAIWGVLVGTMSDETLLSWGWRIPFLGSVIILFFAVWIRRSLKESPVFEARADVKDGVAVPSSELREIVAEGGAEEMRSGNQRKGRGFVVALFLRLGQAGNSGMIQTYLVSYITAVLLMTKSVGTNVVIISSLVGFATVPLVGWLSDLVGRKTMYITMASIAIVLAFPMMLILSERTVPAVFAGYIVMHQTSVLALASLENLTMSEIFGARNRYTQLALAKELAAIVGTGAGPVIASAWVAATTGSWVPIAVMLAFFSVCSLSAAIAMPEVAGRDLTLLTDCRPGESRIGPFARREQAALDRRREPEKAPAASS